MTTTDPLSRLYTAFVEELRTNPQLTNLVYLANFIRYDKDNEHPELSLRTDSDMPTIAIIPAGMALGGSGNSSSSFALEVSYNVAAQSGSYLQNTPASINPVMWQLHLSLERIRRRNGVSGMPEIRQITYGPGSIQMGDAEGENRLPAGFYLLTQIRFLLVFSLAEYI